jgi:hypothetical protein
MLTLEFRFVILALALHISACQLKESMGPPPSPLM